LGLAYEDVPHLIKFRKSHFLNLNERTTSIKQDTTRHPGVHQTLMKVGTRGARGEGSERPFDHLAPRRRRRTLVLLVRG